MVRLLFHRKILIQIPVPIQVPALIPDQVPTQALAQTQDPVLIQALYLMKSVPR